MHITTNIYVIMVKIIWYTSLGTKRFSTIVDVCKTLFIVSN